MMEQDRRTFVKTGAAIGSAAIVGLSGCLGDSDDGGNGGDSGNGDSSGNGDDVDFPSQQRMEIIIPYGTGGASDQYMRTLGQPLSDHFDVDIEYNNITGASTMNAFTELSNSEPDGHTFFGGAMPGSYIGYHLVEPDFEIEPFEPLAIIDTFTYTFFGNPEHDLGGDPMGMFDLYASGELENLGTIIGSGNHLALVTALQHEDTPAGIDDVNIVGYDGGAEIFEAVVSGEVPVGFTTYPGSEDFIENGDMDIIGWAATEGHYVDEGPSLPEAGGPNIDGSALSARPLIAPPETPEPILEELSDGIMVALESDEMQDWSEDTGNPVNPRGREGALEYWDGLMEVDVPVDLLQG